MAATTVLINRLARQLATGLVIGGLTSLNTWAANSTSLNVCEDAVWPPYTFQISKAGTTRLDGVSYELLQALAHELNLQVDFHILPWKRCLAQVYAYPQTGMEMFINGSSNRERVSKYHRTVPVFNVRRSYAFHRDHADKFNNIRNVTDLNNMQVCGVLGYNYEDVIDAGLTATIQTPSTTVQAAIDRVINKQCEVMLTTYEVVEGGIALSNLKASPDFVHRLLPGIEPDHMHYWITRSSPRSESLLKDFNAAIKKLQANGTADRIFGRFLPDGDGIP